VLSIVELFINVLVSYKHALLKVKLISGFGNTITVSNKLKEVSVKVGPFGPPT